MVWISFKHIYEFVGWDRHLMRITMLEHWNGNFSVRSDISQLDQTYNNTWAPKQCLLKFYSHPFYYHWQQWNPWHQNRFLSMYWHSQANQPTDASSDFSRKHQESIIGIHIQCPQGLPSTDSLSPRSQHMISLLPCVSDPIIHFRQIYQWVICIV